ncbi:MAG: tetratricopeptide repeat protein, partial [Candidatus Heimdallarchaeota archaeon]
EALKAVEQLRASGTSAEDWEFVHQLLSFEVDILGKLGKSQALKKIIGQVNLEYHRFGRLLPTVDILYKISQFFFAFGDHRESKNVAVQAEELISSFEGDSTLEIKERKAQVINQKAFNIRDLGEYETALKAHEQALAIFKKLGNKAGIANTLIYIGWVYGFCMGDIERLFEYAQQSLPIAEEANNKRSIFLAVDALGDYYYWKDESEKALNYYQRSLALREETRNKWYIASGHLDLGRFFMNKGKLILADRHLKTAIKLSKEINATFYVARGYMYSGDLCVHKGDYAHALENLHQSLELYKHSGNKRELALSLNFIGDVYRDLGDLDKARTYYTQCLSYTKENYPFIYAVGIGDLGILSWQKGELDTGYNHLQKALVLLEGIGNEYEIMNCLFSLILVCLDMNSVENAQAYFQRLQPQKEDTPSAWPEDKLRSQLSRIAEALILKKSNRIRHRGKAEQLLADIVDEKIVQHRLTVMAMLHLCDLLLREMRDLGKNFKLQQEISNLLDKLINISKSSSSFRLLPETFLLKSKLALLELDFNGAQDLLEEAQMLAEEKGLQLLAAKIVNEQRRLTDQIEKWGEFLKKDVPLSDIQEFIQIEEFITKMVRNRMVHKKLDVPQYTQMTNLGIKQEQEESK